MYLHRQSEIYIVSITRSLLAPLASQTKKNKNNGQYLRHPARRQRSHHINQPLAVDLLNPSAEAESKKHKLKRLVQSPNSYFMDVKCPGMWKFASACRRCSYFVEFLQDASAFPPYSLMHRPSSCAARALAYCVSPRVVGQGSLKVSTTPRLAHIIFNALHQGAHTVGRIEYSLPCIHPTCCLRRYFDSGYSFRLSPCNLLNQTSSHSDTHPKFEDARPAYLPPTKQRRDNSFKGV